MTLAVILLVSIFCAPSVRPSVGVDTARQSAAQTQAQGSASPAQSPTPAPPISATPAATSKQTPSDKKPAAVNPPRRKKKQVTSNCVPAVGSATSTPASTTPALTTSGSTTSESATVGSATAGSTPAGGPTQDPARRGTAPTPATASAPTVCPPPKVIVRQGGTVEPSIQLAGGAGGDQATRQRANQMLGATEENLKKLAGRQLAANQQDMVKQVHQFEAQSKSAIAAGDFERGRTLAWKAQLLSEELVNPAK